MFERSRIFPVLMVTCLLAQAMPARAESRDQRVWDRFHETLATHELALELKRRGRNVVLALEGDYGTLFLRENGTGRVVNAAGTRGLPRDPEAAIAHLLLVVQELLRTPERFRMLNPWNIPFTRDVVAALHAPPSVMVVAAGRRTESTLWAASSLRGAYLGGEARIVLGSETLGEVSALDDAAIVARAARVDPRVEQVAISRVAYPGNGRAPRATVTVYDRAGAVVTSFAATEGQPLGSRAKPSPYGSIDWVPGRWWKQGGWVWAPGHWIRTRTGERL